tara:strand:+ start:6660 stop:7607 length:948 start_codon:yes stop_codon:yes gene_type:complete
MKLITLNLIRIKKKIWIFSLLLILLSLSGILMSSFYPSIRKPINLGMDYLGGNEIRLERKCEKNCSEITSDKLIEELNIKINDKNLVNNIRIQIQNDSSLLSIRTPFLNIDKSEELISDINEIVGPINFESKISRSIGPRLGKDLLINGGISLLVSLLAISIYISIRFDRKFSLLALSALFHDLFIVFGLFSWLGIILSVEVNSLFAVALLTIAGYSVNDTVVIFDRIRENIKTNPGLKYNKVIEISVNETLRRTIFTSLTTLIPLLTLILFGSYSLFWFSFALISGILIGSYSSILLAPSLLLKDEINTKYESK